MLAGFKGSEEVVGIFDLIPRLSEPVVIGVKTLQGRRLKPDFEADEVIIDPRVTKLCLLWGFA